MNYDITFCANELCKKKSKCGRHMSVLSGKEIRVSVSIFNEKKCSYFFKREKLKEIKGTVNYISDDPNEKVVALKDAKGQIKYLMHVDDYIKLNTEKVKGEKK